MNLTRHPGIGQPWDPQTYRFRRSYPKLWCPNPLFCGVLGQAFVQNLISPLRREYCADPALSMSTFRSSGEYPAQREPSPVCPKILYAWEFKYIVVYCEKHWQPRDKLTAAVCVFLVAHDLVHAPRSFDKWRSPER